MVEQERRAVDQGPGDVLGGGEPAGGGLLDAHLDVAAELARCGSGGTGLLALASWSAGPGACGSTGSGARLAASASARAAVLGVDDPEVGEQGVVLGLGPQLGGDGEDGAVVLGQAEAERPARRA